MTNLPQSYEDHAQGLLSRIREVGKKHPAEVLALENPWGLFDLGLKNSTSDETFAMASVCLGRVKAEIRAAKATQS